MKLYQALSIALIFFAVGVLVGWTAGASDRANKPPVARNSAKLPAESTKLPKTAHGAHTEPNLTLRNKL